MDVEQDLPRKKRKVGKETSKPPTVTPLPSNSLRTLRKTGRSAHLIFLDEVSLPKALSSGSKPRPWPKLQDADSAPSGMAHYIQLYSSLRPPLDVVRAHADSSIDLYEFELAKSRQNSKYKKGEAIVDDDGFTLVTRGGAYGKTLGGGVGVASKQFTATAGRGGSGRMRKQKKDPKEKESFYAFQKAEKQRKGESFHRICDVYHFTHVLYSRVDGFEAKMGGRQSESGKAEGIASVQALLINAVFHCTYTVCFSMLYWHATSNPVLVNT